jgi:hypothetical protein
MRAVRVLVRFAAAAAGVGLISSCGDDAPEGSLPTVFDVVVSVGAGDLGALLFNIEGGPVDTVESVGYYTASAPYSGIATQVVVAGGQLLGPIARIRVPDGRISYRAVPREGAERGTHRLLVVSDSLVRLVPVLR